MSMSSPITCARSCFLRSGLAAVALAVVASACVPLAPVGDAGGPDPGGTERVDLEAAARKDKPGRPTSTTTTTTTTTTTAPTTTTTVAPPPTSTTTTVPASGNWWKPTADRPLRLHWVLHWGFDVNNPVHLGLRDMQGNALPEPDVYNIDGEGNPKRVVDTLKSRGKKVICYIDVGAYETYRSDRHLFPPEVIGLSDGWDGSYWLDIRRIDILEPIMKGRLRMCADKGFDAVEPDQMDGYENRTGFPLTYEDQLRYNRAIARWAHELNLSVGLKGNIVQVKDLVNDFDWTLNEECFAYNECLNPWDPRFRRSFEGLQLFTRQNKAVWVAEYKAYSSTEWSDICKRSNEQRWNTARYQLDLSLTGGRMPCPGGW
jgi:endo-alpha-1,4-polygalactosaminidase (GH114 family)